MSEDDQPIIRALKRLLLASPLPFFGWYLLATAAGGWTAVPRLLSGMACLLAFAIAVAGPLASLAAEGLGSLFVPGERLRRAPPMYGIPESRRKRGQTTESFAAYREIAAKYPDEVKPWIDMVDMAVIDLQDANMAAQLFREGMQALRRAEDQATLTRMYGAIISRIDRHAPVEAPLRYRPQADPSPPHGLGDRTHRLPP